MATNDRPSGARPVRDPGTNDGTRLRDAKSSAALDALECALIDEFLADRGHTLQSIRMLPAARRRELLRGRCGACQSEARGNRVAGAFRQGPRTVRKIGGGPMSHIKSILVPVDFSAASARALASARDLAAAFGATIHLLHVFETPLAMGAFMDMYTPAPDDYVESLATRARAQLEALLTEQERTGGMAVVAVRMGMPADEILQVRPRARRHRSHRARDERPRPRRATHDGQRRGRDRALRSVPGPHGSSARPRRGDGRRPGGVTLAPARFYRRT